MKHLQQVPTAPGVLRHHLRDLRDQKETMKPMFRAFSIGVQLFYTWNACSFHHRTATPTFLRNKVGFDEGSKKYVLFGRGGDF